jgi:aryl-alcohol dehydrogenase-like predicted oxidoreductase
MQSFNVSGLKAFPLTLGGNVFGWTASRDQSFAVLDAYSAAGGNFVDTADAYSRWVPGHTGGESEAIIGEWLAARRNRSDVVVATKAGRHPEFTGLKAGTIKRAAEASLRRLGTDYIDLYYTHYDDESVPVEEIVTALDGLVREGKVRAIGASNISPQRLDASLAFAESAGLARYVALQPHYNLVSRGTYEGGLREAAERHDLAVIPYYSLASGFLTGKYRPGAVPAGSERARGAVRYLQTERGQKVLAALDAVAQARGCEPATVALAWLAAQPTVTATLASARTAEQLPALLAAVSLRLTGAELAALTDASGQPSSPRSRHARAVDGAR